MGLRKALSAGMIDAGFASLASLGMGLYAARVLDANVLGVFALFFTAFVTAALISQQLIFVPSEVKALEVEGEARLRVLPRTLPLGGAAALAAAVIAGLIAWVIAPDVEGGTGLAIAMTVCSTLSPVQDHLRRLLHLAGTPWSAAAVSLVQFVGLLVGLVVLESVDLTPAAIPFGALTIANAVSLSLGLLLARLHMRGITGSISGLDFRALARSGSRLVWVGLFPAATGFIVAAILIYLEDAEAMGHAEAARVLSRPILVVGVGLGSALRPRSMEAAKAYDQAGARSVRKIFAAILIGGGLLYLPYAAFDWRGNVLSALVDNAYAVGGLVAVSIIAVVVDGVTWPQNFELTAAGFEARLAKIEGAAALIRIAVVAVLATVVGAFAIPLGLLALGLCRVVAFNRATNTHYGASGTGDSTHEH